jgi:hypothetical protein
MRALACPMGMLQNRRRICQASSSGQKQWQIVPADADEDGVFKITVARPGVYILLVHGKAGFNDAFWVSGDLIVKLGTETSIKLSQPQKSCMDSEP